MPEWIRDSTRRFRERPLFTETEIEAEARRSIEGLALTGIDLSYPLPDDSLIVLVESLVESFDRLADLSNLPEEVDGYTDFSLVGGLPTVYINRDLSEGRYRKRWRMTVAHECGHVVLHQPLYTPDHRQLDLLTVGESAPPIYCNPMGIAKSTDWREWQASYFAGALLAPRRLIEEELGPRYGKLLDRPHIDRSDEAAELVDRIASGFDISREASLVRLGQLRLIRPSVQTAFADLTSR